MLEQFLPDSKGRRILTEPGRGDMAVHGVCNQKLSVTGPSSVR